MAKLVSTNPSKNYEVIGEVEISFDDEINEKVVLANQAKLGWKELGVMQRVEKLTHLYKKFDAKKDELAGLITAEMGKPISQSKGEVGAALDDMKWFLENAEKSLANEVTFEDEQSLHQIVYEPWGVAAVITPWNYPFEMFVWGVFANLVAGNTVVFKISEECVLCGKLIEEIMASGDLPEGVFAEVHGAGDVGEKLAKSDVDLIWFTGSTKVGKELYKIGAEKFVKVVLEMGGSSPAVVFEDADLSTVIPHLYGERYGNCGQVCDAIKRLIVHESLYNGIVEGLAAEVKKKKIGDPQDEQTDIGCLVAERQVDLLKEQVEDARDKGANVLSVGEVDDNLKGAFHEPMILTNVNNEMRVWREEVFGPVLPVVSFKTEEEAVELANDTRYGLGSRVYSRDLERAKRVADRIEAGTVEINNVSRWLHCNPFGGYKESGMGREMGVMGFRELCQVKVVALEK